MALGICRMVPSLLRHVLRGSRIVDETFLPFDVISQGDIVQLRASSDYVASMVARSRLQLAQATHERFPVHFSLSFDDEQDPYMVMRRLLR
jgi:hypothetical protein